MTLPLTALMPVNGPSVASLDPSMAYSSTAFSKALSLSPNLASQAASEVSTGGVVPLGGTSGMALNPVGTATHTPAEMQKVAKQFEAIFLRMMLKEMRATVEKNPLFPNSKAMETFESMQDDTLADHLSEHGIGLGDMVYRQLLGNALKNNQKTASTPS
jgi:flagellar protein FlgJ